MQSQSPRATLLWLGAFAVGLGCIRVVLAAHLELSPDEAYYHQWSKQPGWTYLDHPPLIAWLVRMGTSIVGENAVGVRLFCVLAGSFGSIILYAIGRQVGLAPRRALSAAVIGSLLPMPATGALVATPDTPLALCWLICVWALLGVARPATGQESTLGWLILFGSIGVGLWAKHTAALMLVLPMVAFVASGAMQTKWKTFRPWAGVLLCLVIVAPYFVAERKAGFSSISFQCAHLAGHLEPTAQEASVVIRFLELIGGQFGLMTPVVAVFAIIGVRRMWRQLETRILAAALLVPILTTAISAVFTHPQQNWASLGHPLAALLAVAAVPTFPSSRKKVAMIGMWTTALCISAIIHLHAAHPFLPLPPRRDPVSRLHGWGGLERLSNPISGVSAVVCDNYGLAAEVDWVLKPKGIRVGGLDRGFAPPRGTWLLLDEGGDPGRAPLHVTCAKKQFLASLNLKRGDGAVVRVVSVWRGVGCFVRKKSLTPP